MPTKCPRCGLEHATLEEMQAEVEAKRNPPVEVSFMGEPLKNKIRLKKRE